MLHTGHSRGPEYKSVYFNVDEYTGPIFMVGTAGAVLLNAAVRALAGILWRRRMRWYVERDPVQLRASY